MSCYASFGLLSVAVGVGMFSTTSTKYELIRTTKVGGCFQYVLGDILNMWLKITIRNEKQKVELNNIDKSSCATTTCTCTYIVRVVVGFVCFGIHFWIVGA